LKEEHVREMFQDRMNVLYEESGEQNMWLKYRDSALKAEKETYGVSKGKPQHGELGGSNRMSQMQSKEKRRVLANGRKNNLKKKKNHYQKDKKDAKKAVVNAMKSEAEKEP